MNKSDILIRDAVAEDVPFIMSTFLKGLLYGGDVYFRKIEKNSYFNNYHTVVQKLLSKPGATCKVACLKDSEDVILGWCAYRPIESGAGSIIDFVFVKKDWRHIGLAKSMWPLDTVAVTHLTKAAETILKSHPKIKFDPYL